MNPSGFWVGLGLWIALVAGVVIVLWGAMAVLDRRLRRRQAQREATAVAQAETALVRWREARQGTELPEDG